MRFVVLSMLLSSCSFAATPRPAVGKQVMAASAHAEATKAAVTILKAGGNAVDAAVAAAFAIPVVEPFSAGIGGGGFAVVFDSTSTATLALDFRETAPAKATRDMYVDDKGKVIEGRS